MEVTIHSTIVEVIRGDITQSGLDCIVNAANTSLLGGGGVDGAIHRAGGREILDACVKIRNRQGNCPVGEAVITTGGKLNAKFVIHTVGPVWKDGHHEEPQLLGKCYSNTLKLATENDIRSISFPNISTGIYRYPKVQAAEVALRAVIEYLANHSSFDRIQFVCFDEENERFYRERLSVFA